MADQTTTDEPRFTLNRKDGVDTLHVEHPHEECNVDDATGVTKIDEITAEAMLSRRDVVPCAHCKPNLQVEL